MSPSQISCICWHDLSKYYIAVTVGLKSLQCSIPLSRVGTKLEVKW
jgi:hypothetical protein